MAQEALHTSALAGSGFRFATFSRCSEDLSNAFDSGAPDVALIVSFLRKPGDLATTVIGIRRAFREIPIIAVCPFEKREEVLDAIALGVAGCVSTEGGLDRLAEAIRTVQHRSYVCPIASALLLQAPQSSAGEAHLRAARDLTHRERQILKMIADGSTDREIAKAYNLSIRTVNTHRANMMAKLGVHNSIQLVRHAIQLGLIGA
jgi:DNA-binding NarL/FixJ family response regulator